MIQVYNTQHSTDYCNIPMLGAPIPGNVLCAMAGTIGCGGPLENMLGGGMPRPAGWPDPGPGIDPGSGNLGIFSSGGGGPTKREQSHENTRNRSHGGTAMFDVLSCIYNWDNIPSVVTVTTLSPRNNTNPRTRFSSRGGASPFCRYLRYSSHSDRIRFMCLSNALKVPMNVRPSWRITRMR